MNYWIVNYHNDDSYYKDIKDNYFSMQETKDPQTSSYTELQHSRKSKRRIALYE